jgi:hypothetical protein
MAMALLVGVVDEKFRGRDAFAFRFFDAEESVELQTVQRGFERIPIRAGVDERTYRHVAADAREGVEIAEFRQLSEFTVQYVPGALYVGQRLLRGWREGGEMTHLAAGPGLELPIKVQLHVGDRGGGRPIWLMRLP